MKKKRPAPDGPTLCEKHATQVGNKSYPDGDCEPRATWPGGHGYVTCDVAMGSMERTERYLAHHRISSLTK